MPPRWRRWGQALQLKVQPQPKLAVLRVAAPVSAVPLQVRQEVEVQLAEQVRQVHAEQQRAAREAARLEQQLQQQSAQVQQVAARKDQVAAHK